MGRYGGMRRESTAIVESEADGYVALWPEVDVAGQGGTPVEVRANLQEGLELHFETASAVEIEWRICSEVCVTRVEAAVG